MTASAPTALEDLGAFIFGNHALHLQQQVVLGCAADGTVQEDNLGAAAVSYRETDEGQMRT